jgi:molybdopterin-guanine dinucleotide biosynthesis adapter protein
LVPVVTIVGKPDSGKTVLAQKLITELKSRGHRVAAAKHAHKHVDTDTPGKDTWLFTQAGSQATVLATPTGVTLYKNLDGEAGLSDALAALGESYDIVIAEGFRKSRAPKIVMLESGNNEIIPDEPGLCAAISDEPLQVKLPHFKRNDVQEIADFIEKEIMDRAPSDMEITVNGKPLFMKPFVKDIIGSSILAMLASLKTVAIIKNVLISIRNRQ